MNTFIKYPIKIGLTGGIGAGKTTTSKIIQNLGVPIFNSDECGKKIIQSNQFAIDQIIRKFGKDIVLKNKVNIKKLGKIVFANKLKLKVLNNIIHPQVAIEFNKWLNQQKTKYIIKESAILLETNTYKKLDKIILIKAPLKLRIQRVCKRDKRSVQEVKKIISNQLKDAEASKYADYVINNNEKELLLPQIIKLHKILSRL